MSEKEEIVIKSGFAPGLSVVCTAVLLLFASVTVCAQDWQSSSREIKQAVEKHLLVNEYVPFQKISTRVAGHMVTLMGQVPSLLAKNKAARLAGMVRGVVAVQNNLKVLPDTSITDGQVSSNVQANLQENPALVATDFTVSTQNGQATLTGRVASWQEKQLAAKVASAAKGVTALQNNLEIDYSAKKTDEELKNDIRQAILLDLRIPSAFVEVQVDNGLATLTGSVGSAAGRQQAVATAWTAGAAGVNADELQVTWQLHNKDLKDAVHPGLTDSIIQVMASRRLSQDVRLNGQKPLLRVRNGRASLQGTVENYQARKAASETVSLVTGVWSVDNFIKVRPAVVPPNNMLKEKVEQAFARNAGIKRKNILVDVYNGRVHLNGVVNSYQEKLRASEIVEELAGVMSIDNNLQVNTAWAGNNFPADTESWYSPFFSRPLVMQDQRDNEIRDDIEYYLWWSPNVDPEDIQVTVENGHATLTGEVGNWVARRFATMNALKAGAMTVSNRLKVTGPFPFTRF